MFCWQVPVDSLREKEACARYENKIINYHVPVDRKAIAEEIDINAITILHSKVLGQTSWKKMKTVYFSV